MSGQPAAVRWLAVVVACALMVACSGSDDAGTGIPVQDPEAVALGDDLYQEHCASCHGADLRGTDEGPSHLSIVYEPNHHGDASFFLAVRNGVPQHHFTFGAMAPIPALSDPEIEAIVAFVRENQRIHGFEPYPPG